MAHKPNHVLGDTGTIVRVRESARFIAFTLDGMHIEILSLQMMVTPRDALGVLISVAGISLLQE